MVPRFLALIILIAKLVSPAAAQQRVSVVTQRLAADGALFIAGVKGYFKAEGIDIQVGAYNATREVLEAVASGRSDFGLTELTPAAFNLAGHNAITIVAAQAREKRDFEGAELVASNAAYDRGIRKFEDIAGKVVGIETLGTQAHYQLSEVARVKGFKLPSMTVQTLYTANELAKAVETGRVDAAILPQPLARDVITASQGKLIGWMSDIGEMQTGALFTTPKMIKDKRETVEKFVRAYRRGVAEYAAAMLRRDRYAKRVSDDTSQKAAGIIARFVYPDTSTGPSIIDATAPYVDPKARIDVDDLERQLAWYKAQGFVEKTVAARNIVDLSFTAGN